MIQEAEKRSSLQLRHCSQGLALFAEDAQTQTTRESKSLLNLKSSENQNHRLFPSRILRLLPLLLHKPHLLPSSYKEEREAKELREKKMKK